MLVYFIPSSVGLYINSLSLIGFEISTVTDDMLFCDFSEHLGPLIYVVWLGLGLTITGKDVIVKSSKKEKTGSEPVVLGNFPGDLTTRDLSP